jgi:hypothetical protein
LTCFTNKFSISQCNHTGKEEYLIRVAWITTRAASSLPITTREFFVWAISIDFLLDTYFRKKKDTYLGADNVYNTNFGSEDRFDRNILCCRFNHFSVGHRFRRGRRIYDMNFGRFFLLVRDYGTKSYELPRPPDLVCLTYKEKIGFFYG